MLSPRTSQGARECWAVHWLDMLPWASAADLACLGERSLGVAYQALAELELSGRAVCYSVSAGGPPHRRFALSGAAGEPLLRRHQPEVVAWCAANPGMVEGGYRLLGDLVSAGRRLGEFRWEAGRDFQGVARFDDGWCVLLWSGWGETVAALRRRLERSVARGFPGGASPGLWCVVSADRFQAELALRAGREAGLEGRVAVATAVGGQLCGAGAGLSDSRSWYASARRPVEGLHLGCDGPGGVWVGRGARRRVLILGAAELWPGAGGPLLLKLTGQGRRGYRDDLADLRRDGLLVDMARGGYGCGPAWRALAARRDGGGEVPVRGPLLGRWRREWQRLLARALERGWQVVPGWRAAGWFDGPAPDVVVGRDDGGELEWEGISGVAEARRLLA